MPGSKGLKGFAAFLTPTRVDRAVLSKTSTDPNVKVWTLRALRLCVSIQRDLIGQHN